MLNNSFVDCKVVELFVITSIIAIGSQLFVQSAREKKSSKTLPQHQKESSHSDHNMEKTGHHIARQQSDSAFPGAAPHIEKPQAEDLPQENPPYESNEFEPNDEENTLSENMNLSDIKEELRNLLAQNNLDHIDTNALQAIAVKIENVSEESPHSPVSSANTSPQKDQVDHAQSINHDFNQNHKNEIEQHDTVKTNGHQESHLQEESQIKSDKNGIS